MFEGLKKFINRPVREEFYSLSDIYILRVGNLEDDYGYLRFGRCFYMIAKLYNSLGLKKYKEIFTNEEVEEAGPYNICGRLYVANTYSISSFCTDEELLCGKISKKRLIEIYRQINKDNDKVLSRKER